MRRVRAIAIAEFLNTVLSRGFLLAVLLTPVFMGGSVLVQSFVKERVDTADRLVAVYDETGLFFERIVSTSKVRNEKESFIDTPAGRRQIAAKFVFESAPVSKDRKSILSLADRVRERTLSGYLLIPKGVVEGEEGIRITYHTETHTFTELPRWLEGVLTDEIRRLRLDGTGLSVEQTEKIVARAPLKWRKLHERAADGGLIEAEKVDLAATFGVPAAAMILMFLLVFMSVPMLLHSVIEEKQQRIWEVLVSSVTPFQLLLGKLLGAVLVSMALSCFYLGGAAMLAREFGVADAIPYSLYIWFLFFQLLALLIYGSMFSAIGAACSELRDAQSLMTPAMFLIIVPMLGWVAIVRAPMSAFSRGLSLFPPATPMLMMLRIAMPPGPEAWEVGLAVVLTTAFTLFAVWAAAKVFRVGILAQGQTPTIGRLLSWIVAK